MREINQPNGDNEMKNYNVEQVFENGDRHTGDDMSKVDAITEATRLSVKFDDRNIFIRCAGNGGAGCYLNPDGNHNLTGLAW